MLGKCFFIMLLMSALLLLLIEAKNQDEASLLSQRHKVKHQHKKDAKHEFYLRKHLEEDQNTKTLEASSGASKDDVKLQLDLDKSSKLGEVTIKEVKMQELSNGIQEISKVQPETQHKREAEVTQTKEEKVKENENSSKDLPEVPAKKVSQKKKKIDEAASNVGEKGSEKTESKVRHQKPSNHKKSSKGKSNGQKGKENHKKESHKKSKKVKGQKNEKDKRGKVEKKHKDKKSKHS